LPDNSAFMLLNLNLKYNTFTRSTDGCYKINLAMWKDRRDISG